MKLFRIFDKFLDILAYISLFIVIYFFIGVWNINDIATNYSNLSTEKLVGNKQLYFLKRYLSETGDMSILSSVGLSEEDLSTIKNPEAVDEYTGVTDSYHNPNASRINASKETRLKELQARSMNLAGQYTLYDINNHKAGGALACIEFGDVKYYFERQGGSAIYSNLRVDSPTSGTISGQGCLLYAIAASVGALENTICTIEDLLLASLKNTKNVFNLEELYKNKKLTFDGFSKVYLLDAVTLNGSENASSISVYYDRLGIGEYYTFNRVWKYKGDFDDSNPHSNPDNKSPKHNGAKCMSDFFNDDGSVNEDRKQLLNSDKLCYIIYTRRAKEMRCNKDGNQNCSICSSDQLMGTTNHWTTIVGFEGTNVTDGKFLVLCNGYKQGGDPCWVSAKDMYNLRYVFAIERNNKERNE